MNSFRCRANYDCAATQIGVSIPCTIHYYSMRNALKYLSCVATYKLWLNENFWGNLNLLEASNFSCHSNMLLMSQNTSWTFIALKKFKIQHSAAIAWRTREILIWHTDRVCCWCLEFSKWEFLANAILFKSVAIKCCKIASSICIVSYRYSENNSN